MNDWQICNTTSTVSGTVTITEQTCSPQIRYIDYYYAFVITLGIFIAAFMVGYKTAHKKP